MGSGRNRDPFHSDAEIIEWVAQNPTVTRTLVQKKFRTSPNRAKALVDRGRLRAQKGLGGKKVGKVDWRKEFAAIEQARERKKERTWSQDYALIDLQKFTKVKGPIVIQNIGDTHLGSMATDHQKLQEITEGVLKTPNLFWILNGDLTETTAVFRNALAVHSQGMDIETQHAVLESWLDTIAPKVISAGWDNHGVEREEKLGAFSHIKQLLSRRFIYHNGLGRIDLMHGDAIYRLLVSHKLSGYSIFNHLHGAKRIVRLEFPSVDVVMTADKHTPAVETYYDGDMRRGVMMAGSLKIDDGYSKRYFSLFTQTDMPAVVLWPEEKWFGVYMTADEALAVASMKHPPRR